MGHQPDVSATTDPMTCAPQSHASAVPSRPADRRMGTPAHTSAGHRRWRGAAASLTVATAIALAGAGGAAAADPSDGGLWYYTATGMDTIHQTTKGKGITIAVLDSPVNPAAPDLVGADITVHEPSYCAATKGGPALPATSSDPTALHGSGMDGIIVGTGAGINGQPGQRGIAPQATIHHYAIGYELDGADGCRPSAELAGKSGRAAAIDQAVADGADIISVSYHRTADEDEGFDAIGRALKAGVILVASAPHDGGTTIFYPASANGVVAVESIDPTGALAPETTTSPLLTVVAPGEHFREIDTGWASYAMFSGSSNATAYTSAALALVWSAYPKATANQILQTLIRNTNGTDHPLKRDDSGGYGLVNVRQMLEHDPTQYPDTNPLLRDGAKPSTSQILATPTTAPTADASTGAATRDTTADGTDDGPSTGVPTALLVGGGIVLAVLLLLVIGGIVLAIVLTRRRSAPPTAPGVSNTPPGIPGTPGPPRV